MIATDSIRLAADQSAAEGRATICDTLDFVAAAMQHDVTEWPESATTTPTWKRKAANATCVGFLGLAVAAGRALVSARKQRFDVPDMSTALALFPGHERSDMPRPSCGQRASV